jgi:hypothetical protein
MSNVLDTANALRDAVFAIETELGKNPKSIYGNVKTRLDVIESRINNLSGLNQITLVGSGDAGASFDCYINESLNGLSFEDNTVYKLTLDILISNLTNPIKKAFIRKEVLLSKESGVIDYSTSETLAIIGSTGWSASVVDSSNELFVRIASDVDDNRQAYVKCEIQSLSI